MKTLKLILASLMILSCLGIAKIAMCADVLEYLPPTAFAALLLASDNASEHNTTMDDNPTPLP